MTEFIDLKKAKAAELNELIDLFVEAGAVLPTEEGALSNNAKRAAFIEAQVALNEGLWPHKVTKEDIEANPDAPELKLGEIVFLPAPTEEDTERSELLSRLTTLKGTDEITEAENALSNEELLALVEKLGKDAAAPKKGNTAPKKEDAGADPEVIKFPKSFDGVKYRGQDVMDARNKIMNGKRYIEVETHTETHLITTEEYKRDVR